MLSALLSMPYGFAVYAVWILLPMPSTSAVDVLELNAADEIQAVWRKATVERGVGVRLHQTQPAHT